VSDRPTLKAYFVAGSTVLQSEMDDLIDSLALLSELNAHGHAGVYSPVGHSHTGEYAVTTHNHDGSYAATSHNHDAAYAAAVHQARHQTGGTDPITGNISAKALVGVKANSDTIVSTRRNLRVNSGINTSLTVTDDPANDTAVINFNATAGQIDIDALPAASAVATTDHIMASVAGAERKVTIPNFVKGKRAEIVVTAANARNSAYGDAVCTGIADEATINNAISDLATPGGVVRLSEGSFNLNSPILLNRSSVSLLGQGTKDFFQTTYVSSGILGTSLVPTGTFAGSAVVMVQLASDANPAQGVKLADFVIHGNRLPVGVPVDGVLFRAYKSKIRDISVYKCTGNGVKLLGYEGWNTYETMLQGIIASWNTLDGVRFDSNTADMHGSDFLLNNNGRYGMYHRSSGNMFNRVHGYGNLTNLFVDVSSISKFMNCKFENAKEHGVIMDSTNGSILAVSLIGCNFRSNGFNANNTYDDLLMGSNFGGGASANDVNRVIVAHCNFLHESTDTPNKVRYHVNLFNNSVKRCIIGPNDFGTGGIALTAPINRATTASGTTANQIIGSLGWKTKGHGTHTSTPGAVMSITIPHGVAGPGWPDEVHVVPANANAALAPTWHVSVDATNILLTFTSPLTAATSYSWRWSAEKVYGGVAGP
jgi:hypothetical protein